MSSWKLSGSSDRSRSRTAGPPLSYTKSSGNISKPSRLAISTTPSSGQRDGQVPAALAQPSDLKSFKQYKRLSRSLGNMFDANGVPIENIHDHSLMQHQGPVSGSSGDLLSAKSPGSGFALGWVASPHQNNISPVVRSISSYSYLGLSARAIVTSIIKSAEPMSSKTLDEKNSVLSSSLTGSATESQLQLSLRLDSNNSHIPQSSLNESLQSIVTEEGVLREIELRGFLGVWSHVISRMYFLMFLIFKNHEVLFFLRTETVSFREAFLSYSPNQRTLNAKRIYATYLSTRAVCPVPWPSDMTDPSPEDVIAVISRNLDTPEISIFDDISFLAMQTMEMIYHGIYVPPSTKTEVLNSARLEAVTFRKSPFCEIMRRDLRGSPFSSTSQLLRVVERIFDMGNSMGSDTPTWEKVFSYLESLNYENEVVLTRTVLAKKKTIGRGRSSSFKSSESLEDLSSQSAPKTNLRTLALAQNVERGFAGKQNHTFIQSTFQDPAYCEYCFLKCLPEKGHEHEISGYRCEICGYVSHKNCRTLVGISCCQGPQATDNDIVSEVSAEKLRMINEKLVALQKEVDIEMKIRDGLERISKAKQGAKAKGKKGANDVSTQLENNTKRLEALKHELQKRWSQYQSLQQLHAKQIDEKKLNDVQSPTALDPTENVNEGALIRVMVEDNQTKSQYKKALYVIPDQNTMEVIEKIIEKCNLSGSVSSYALYAPKSDGGERKLREDERPCQIEDMDFASAMFRLCEDNQATGVATKAEKTANDARRKITEILMEILESESNYAQDLKNILTLFVRPLEDSKMLSTEALEDIFCNIESIHAVHEMLGKVLKAANEGETYEPLPIIRAYSENLESLQCYIPYCSNQHNARRKLAKCNQDPLFTKLIQKCEANPKLHKLCLNDLLVKPMHRITRYPLLFKRLLPALEPDSAEAEDLIKLISGIESLTLSVNESVKQKESTYRIRLIDEVLDFGMVVEKFRIAAERRELLSEKSFVLHKKNSSSPPVEVLVLMFNDLLLLVRSKKADSFTLLKKPIPFESALFLDKPDTEDAKHLIHIVHLGEEVHIVQSISSYDKNAWLQEAERARFQFCTLYYRMEQSLMKQAATKYRGLLPTRAATDPLDHDDAQGSGSPGVSLPRRKTADEMSRKSNVSDMERIVRMDENNIKRNSSLLQMFKFRKSADDGISLHDEHLVDDSRVVTLPRPNDEILSRDGPLEASRRMLSSSSLSTKLNQEDPIQEKSEPGSPSNSTRTSSKPVGRSGTAKRSFFRGSTPSLLSDSASSPTDTTQRKSMAQSTTSIAGAGSGSNSPPRKDSSIGGSMDIDSLVAEGSSADNIQQAVSTESDLNKNRTSGVFKIRISMKPQRKKSEKTGNDTDSVATSPTS